MEAVSVIMPNFNGARFLGEAIGSVLAQTYRPVELIVVDDGSSDGTREVLTGLQKRYGKKMTLVMHERNKGKGKAVQSGLARVKGDIVVIQDADLEYHPEEYPKAVALIEEGWADAVYGSRFLGIHRVFLFWHYVGNKMLTLLCNMMTSGMLTDMETGFKLIRADVLRSLDIQSYTFDFEVEVTVKLFRHGYRVYEIPITYTGRGYEEGKKITWKDGVLGIWQTLRYGLLSR